MTEQSPPPVLPWDAHNQKLVSNVHPADWKNPAPAPRYNLVVIGGGTAGLVSAVGAAGLGAKVALIEKHFMGGDCLNVGCVPSKAIIRAARAAAAEYRGAVPWLLTFDTLPPRSPLPKPLRWQPAIAWLLGDALPGKRR